MHFFKYLCVLLMPIVALAIPAPAARPEPDALAAVTSAAELANNPALLHAALLRARQDAGGPLGGIGDLLGDLVGSIGEIAKLLNPETFQAIQTLLRNGAALLDDEGTKTAKNLVTNANNLLTPEFVDQTKGLIGDIAPGNIFVSSLVLWLS
ncbi:hypothetical protein AJ79_00727 [Helicocarpus griseus UAMH5409]|uniref:Uncharacterized protein n=1 Tax=Helicocarpus griseus UAMH5409 TaxID=1447875 RepID=A0A2B7YAH4_9EURO|nr:hypothetical protein AJ79_00727 [Helicocarpus griseus UAMH5409]